VGKSSSAGVSLKKENNKIMTRQEIIDQVNSLLEEEFEV
jgi:hypothetical protein